MPRDNDKDNDSRGRRDRPGGGKGRSGRPRGPEKKFAKKFGERGSGSKNFERKGDGGRSSRAAIALAIPATTARRGAIETMRARPAASRTGNSPTSVRTRRAVKVFARTATVRAVVGRMATDLRVMVKRIFPGGLARILVAAGTRISRREIAAI
jgi:hypothetical protein